MVVKYKLNEESRGKLELLKNNIVAVGKEGSGRVAPITLKGAVARGVCISKAVMMFEMELEGVKNVYFALTKFQ